MMYRRRVKDWATSDVLEWFALKAAQKSPMLSWVSHAVPLPHPSCHMATQHFAGLDIRIEKDEGHNTILVMMTGLLQINNTLPDCTV